VEGAGGKVTDWAGGAPASGGRIIASGDPRVHEEALAILNGRD
jgi:myo-inositol-1(or 4)-monophosphatase